MIFSLKTKFIAIFVFFGLFMAGVSSASFYLSFNSLLRNEMESDLTNEAEEFAEHLVIRDGVIDAEGLKEWTELEHIRDSDYSRYVIVTDAKFNTIHRSENLGQHEFQSYHPFKPAVAVESYEIQMDSLRYFCVVYPIFKGEERVGYILAAENFKRVDQFVVLFKRTIFLTLIILIAVGVVIAYILANRVTRPLLEIQQFAGGLDLQSPGKRLELRDTEKEIENLSSSLNRLFDRLEKSFSQINEFSSNVSHELRTPLTILRGNIEVGLSKDRSSEEYVEILSELLEETIHVIRIVDDLLLLARADANALRIQKERFELNQFCEEYSKDWEMICALRKQELRCDHTPDIGVDADKNLLYQLVLNLISNASKFSAGPDPISLSVKKVFSENERKYYAEFTVTDRGIGISEEDLERVFDRFYRANKDRSRETGGTGLGLSICKMITDLHEGTISLKSKPGKGTTVTVRIPAINNGELR